MMVLMQRSCGFTDIKVGVTLWFGIVHFLSHLHDVFVPNSFIFSPFVFSLILFLIME